MDPNQPRSESTHNPKDLPRWLWIGLVPLPALIMLVAGLVDMDVYEALRRKEGPIEWATAGVLPFGIFAAIVAFRRRAVFPAKWLGAWMIICACGMFYFMGEELSWGQHIFKWEAPDAIKEINRQDETNLHNINTFLGRKPKYVIELWTIVGCMAVPLIRKMRSNKPDPRTSAGPWFWPTLVCLPTAIMAQVVYAPTRIARRMYEDEPGWLRLSELQELYFAIALVLYTASIAVRAGSMPKPEAPTTQNESE